ncbi:MAG TPA: hypothetical protein VH081_08325 [Solirubrobacteraceae bacterium]|jgi:hypothetical protein|nr:hypothetical protein [Solirubrobacteraceae bacterium]
MLSGLAVCATITAAFAGVTGAWSPCGFSMVETIGSALGDARRGATLLASATFALGTLIGGVVTFGGLALLGQLIGGHSSWLREALGAALALAAAVADWRGLKLAPQIRRQVPERWRWTMPLPLACALYGILLGLGFTTFVLAFAVWALAGISFAAGDPLLGALVGVAFGAGRAAPVLWLAPGLRRGAGDGDGARRLDEMASEPRLLLGLRRLDALGLVFCALALGGASATASAKAASVAAATDPSASGGELVWQQLAGPGALLNAAGAVSALPGVHPALGGGLVAWASPTAVTVADATTLTPRLALPVTGVTALAVSSSWLVYRRQTAPDGAEQLIAVSLADPARQRRLASAKLPGQIGRPALDGARAVFALNTPRRSAIELVALASGRLRPLRVATRDAQFSNPSLMGGALLFERTTRCLQQLQLDVTTPRRGARERTLLRMRSTVSRDIGYEPGFEHAYNMGSVCGDQGAGGGGKTRLGPTALSGASVYVTEITGVGARIVSLRR